MNMIVMNSLTGSLSIILENIKSVTACSLFNSLSHFLSKDMSLTY